MDENEVVYVGVEDMNANVEGGVVPDTRSTAVKRSGGIIIAWLLLACHLYYGLGARFIARQMARIALPKE